MKSLTLKNSSVLNFLTKSRYFPYFACFCAGLLGPLSFAPFHLSGMAIISVLSFFIILNQEQRGKAFLKGFFYGLAYFGLGVSWVIVSIHDYGNLNYLISSICTLAFIAFLSIYPAIFSCIYNLLKISQANYKNILLFSCLWCLSEYCRANFFSGFAWLLLGTGQIDTPLRHLFPVIGTYGITLLIVYASCFLVVWWGKKEWRNFKPSYSLLILLASLMLGGIIGYKSPYLKINSTPLSVGVIQANLSMRDKWDDNILWNLLDNYQQKITSLLGKQLIILPEAAIPIPPNYLSDYLAQLHALTLNAKSALLLGILNNADEDERSFYNSIISLGQAQGRYDKVHLVPFGEFIPKYFAPLSHALGVELPSEIIAGNQQQNLIKINNHQIASLICYEITYPTLLAQKLPQAELILTFSDSGWFGHSFASQQLLQMAQALSLLSGRYQIFANNAGLSSIINIQGEIVQSLPDFSQGILQGEVYSTIGSTPWLLWGDLPVVFFCIFVVIYFLFLRKTNILSVVIPNSDLAGERKRGYP